MSGTMDTSQCVEQSVLWISDFLMSHEAKAESQRAREPESQRAESQKCQSQSQRCQRQAEAEVSNGMVKSSLPHSI